MQHLFETYDEQGSASLSRIGLLHAVEEAFRNVTQRRSLQVVPDEVEDALGSFCTEMEMNAQANNNSLKKGTFSLGLQQGVDGDLQNLAARRRQSALGTHHISAISEILDEPPTVFMRCDEHGVERFYLGDTMCVKCEGEHLGFFDETDWQSGITGTARGEEVSPKAVSVKPLYEKSMRRKSSFAVH